MEKITKSISKEYAPVVVYLDDLEAIENVLLEKSTHIEIKTEDYKYSSIKELSEKSKNKRIQKLHIESTNPYLNIEFDKLWTRVYCSLDSLEAAGIFWKLDQIIKGTRRLGKLSFFYKFSALWIINGIMVLVSKFLSLNLIIAQSVSVLLLAFTLWILYINLTRHSEIVLIYKSSKITFWNKNKDAIIVNLITALVTFALTLYGKELWDMFQSHVNK